MNAKRTRPLRMIVEKTLPPIVSVVGYSGAGKTTFLEKLILALTRRGYNVGTIKHDVHGFEMDKPGKDSWRHKKAGAATTIISSPNQIGVVMDVDHDHGPAELMPFLSRMDIVLTEGYKRGDTPKLEIFRPEAYKEPICRDDENLLALISDEPLDFGVPRYSIDDIEGVVDFVTKHFNLAPGLSGVQQKAAL